MGDAVPRSRVDKADFGMSEFVKLPRISPECRDGRRKEERQQSLVLSTEETAPGAAFKMVPCTETTDRLHQVPGDQSINQFNLR